MKLNSDRILQIGSLLLGLVFVSSAWSEDFCKSSKITQVAGASVTEKHGVEAERPAQIQDPIVPGDLLKTGADSRAELTAADATVIRVGANSIFSFTDQSRQIELQQGSVLFHTPHGEGGGVIKTAAITAAVTGSTVAMTTTNNGGAKVVPLESTCIVTGKDGRQIASLNPGQLLALMPGGRLIVVNIDLGAFVKSSGLITGFDKPLGSAVQGKIDQNVQRQAGDIQAKTNNFIVGSNVLTMQNPENPLPNPNQIIETAGAPGNTDGSSGNALQAGSSLFGFNFSGVFPDQTLSPSQILGAVNTTFSTPGFQFVVGHNITFQGVTDVPGGPSTPGSSGSSTDPNAANLGGNSSGGFFGIFAAGPTGNMLFRPPNAAPNSLDISFINSPAILEFIAGGTLIMDGSLLAGGNSNVMLNLNAYDAANLVLGSVGTLTLDQICVHSGGNLSVLALNSGVNLYDGVMLSAGGSGSVSVIAQGNINIQQLNSSLGTSNLSGNNVSLISTGGSVTIAGGTGSNTWGVTNSVSISSFGDTNISGIAFGSDNGVANFTVNSLSNINISGNLVSIPSGGNSNVTMTATNGSININAPSFFGGPSMVNLTAFTINLSNLNFGTATVNLTSNSSGGLLNFTASAGGSGGNLPGKINISSGVIDNSLALTSTNYASFSATVFSNIHVH